MNTCPNNYSVISVFTTSVGVLEVKCSNEAGQIFRYTLSPGDVLTGQPDIVLQAAKTAWTADVIAKWAALLAASKPPAPPAPTYADLRRAAYPPMGDQLDALWKGGSDFNDMKKIIDDVKARYPKP